MWYFILVTSALLMVVVPIITLVRYYRSYNYNFFSYVFWVIVTIVSWPLVPFVIAMRKKDRVLIWSFWLSGLAWIGGIVWFVLSFTMV